MIASNVLGMKATAHDGSKYIVTFIDVKSGFLEIAVIKCKAEVPVRWARFHKRLCNKFPNLPVATIRCDNAKEYVSGDFKLYCEAAGIVIDSGTPYTPELNGIAERKNRTIIEKVRALLSDGRRGVDVKFWPFATKMAEYILNRSPSHTNPDFTSPYQQVFGEPPDLNKLHPFGCIVMVQKPKQVRTEMATSGKQKNLAKLGPASEIGVLFGFTETGYIIYVISTKIVRSSCDVKSWTAAFVTHLRAEKNIKPMSLSEAVPGSYASALNNPFTQQWIAAIDDELEAHQDNGTWTIVPRPPKLKAIPTIWKFSVKYPDGQEKAKARLVAFGCADTNKYSIDETYAPVCRVEVVCLVLAIAARKWLKLITIDVTTAFLYGKIKEEIYLSIPDGIDINRKKFVFKLNKSLYGLRTSSRMWTNLLQQKLLSLGFSETPEKCVYQRKYGRKLTLLLTYVDDILIAGNDDDFVQFTTSALQFSFRIRVNYSPTNFIGLDFQWIGQHLYINQPKNYIDRLSNVIPTPSSKTFSMPIEYGAKIEKSPFPNDDRTFRQIIRVVLYIARFSRPDIAYVVNALSWHQGWVTKQNLEQAKRIIHYLAQISTLSLVYCGELEADRLSAFVDASHAPNVTTKTLDDASSITGCLLYFRGCLVDWMSRKQRIITRSSAATEIIAITDVLDNIRMTNHFITKLTNEPLPVIVYKDASSAHAVVMRTNR